MIKFLAIFTSVMVLATAVGAADKQEIMDIDRAFSAMAKAEGTKQAFDHYLSEHATSLNPNSNAVYGRTSVTVNMSTDPSKVLLQWEPEDGMIAASEDLAYTWGNYVLTNKRGVETRYSYGKYTTIWIKEGGSWKAILDIGNSRPAPE